MSNTAGEHSGDTRDRRPGREVFANCIESARQFLFPSPFRIDAPIEIQDEMSTEAHAAKLSGGHSSKAPGEIPAPDTAQLLNTLATVATAIWRARSKLSSESKSELPAELRHVPRHIQAAWDALEAGGIQVQDHKDERYVAGMAVNPITFQPATGIGCEVIQEVLKPTVFFKDILIQRADVIVARPADERELVQDVPAQLDSDHRAGEENEANKNELPPNTTS